MVALGCCERRSKSAAESSHWEGMNPTGGILMARTGEDRPSHTCFAWNLSGTGPARRTRGGIVDYWLIDLGCMAGLQTDVGSPNLVPGEDLSVALTGSEQVRLSTWHVLSNHPVSSLPQAYVEPSPTEAMFFYRLYGAQAGQISTASRVNGWWMAQSQGSRIRVEYVSSQVGWTNWQTLTTVTLPTSPYQFVDEASVSEPIRVYRTTIVP